MKVSKATVVGIIVLVVITGVIGWSAWSCSRPATRLTGHLDVTSIVVSLKERSSSSAGQFSPVITLANGDIYKLDEVPKEGIIVGDVYKFSMDIYTNGWEPTYKIVDYESLGR